MTRSANAKNWFDDDEEVYSPNQVEAVLAHAGVDVVSDTNTHWLAYCPFHTNTDSPAFAVDKTKGLYHCFSPFCHNSGSLSDLLQKVKGLNYFQAQRIILKNKNAHSTPLSERLDAIMNTPPEFTEFSQDVLDKMKRDFPGSIAEEYMKSRGFDDDTLDYFDVGYSKKKGLVIVPMHDPKGMPIGLIGRTPSHTEKRFKNSVNLPKSKTAWNFHRAKKHGETVIICEASYDAMRIHQAGYPNVIALLGGHITQFHVDQINKHFSTIIIMTDFEKDKKYEPNCGVCKRNGHKFKWDEVPCVGHRPGRELGKTIVSKFPHKRVMWAAYDDSCVFPHDAKDASDMTDLEIRQCLSNAVSNLEYQAWDIENLEKKVDYSLPPW